MVFKDKETGKIVTLKSDPHPLNKEHTDFFNKVKEGKYVPVSEEELSEMGITIVDTY